MEHTVSLILPALSQWVYPPGGGDRAPSALAGCGGNRQRTRLSLAAADRTASRASIRVADGPAICFLFPNWSAPLPPKSRLRVKGGRLDPDLRGQAPDLHGQPGAG